MPDKAKRLPRHPSSFGFYFLLALLLVFSLIVCGFGPNFLNKLDLERCAAALQTIEPFESDNNIPLDKVAKQNLAKISRFNASAVREVTRFGRGNIYDAFWNAEGDFLVFTSIGLWRHASNGLFETPELLWTQPFVFWEAVASSNGHYIALKIKDFPDFIPVFDVATGDYQLLTIPDSAGMEHIVFSADDKFLTAMLYKRTYSWDLVTGLLVTPIPDTQSRSSPGGRAASVNDPVNPNAVYSPDMRFIAYGTDIYRQIPHALIFSEPVQGSFHVRFSRDSKQAAYVDFPSNNRLYIVQLDQPENAQPILAYADNYAFNQIAFSGLDSAILGSTAPTPSIFTDPQKTRLGLWEERGSFDSAYYLKLCDGQSGGQIADLRLNFPGVFSHNGQYLASSGECYNLELRSAHTGQTLWAEARCYDFIDRITSIAFTPDDKLMAVARSDTERSWIELVRVDTGETLYSLSGHTREISALTFNTTGTLLASSSWDRTLRLWGIPLQ
jgi:WD40 repeat protein